MEVNIRSRCMDKIRKNGLIASTLRRERRLS